MLEWLPDPANAESDALFPPTTSTYAVNIIAVSLSSHIVSSSSQHVCSNRYRPLLSDQALVVVVVVVVLAVERFSEV